MPYKIYERYTEELIRLVSYDDYEYPEELPNLKKNFEWLCSPETKGK